MKSYLFEPLNLSLTHRSHDEICANISRLCGNTRRILGDQNEPYSPLSKLINAVDKILCSQESSLVQHNNHSKLVCLRPARSFFVDLLEFVSDVSFAASEDYFEIIIGTQPV